MRVSNHRAVVARRPGRLAELREPFGAPEIGAVDVDRCRNAGVDYGRNVAGGVGDRGDDRCGLRRPDWHRSRTGSVATGAVTPTRVTRTRHTQNLLRDAAVRRPEMILRRGTRLRRCALRGCQRISPGLRRKSTGAAHAGRPVHGERQRRGRSRYGLIGSRIGDVQGRETGVVDVPGALIGGAVPIPSHVEIHRIREGGRSCHVASQVGGPVASIIGAIRRALRLRAGAPRP